MVVKPMRWLFGAGSMCALSFAPLPSASPPIRHVTILASDYAFDAPRVLSPGPTAFRLVNHGRVPHEVQLFRFLPSVTETAARAYLASGNVPDSASDPSGSVLIALPGSATHEEVLIDLRQGERYALLCQFRDAPSGPQHATLGMFGLLEVR